MTRFFVSRKITKNKQWIREKEHKIMEQKNGAMEHRTKWNFYKLFNSTNLALLHEELQKDKKKNEDTKMVFQKQPKCEVTGFVVLAFILWDNNFPWSVENAEFSHFQTSNLIHSASVNSISRGSILLSN